MANKDYLKEIKDSLEKNKAIVGTKETIKKSKQGKVSTIYLSKNVPSDIKEDIMRFEKLSEIEIIQLDILNDELGTLCRKPYPISIISIKKV